VEITPSSFGTLCVSPSTLGNDSRQCHIIEGISKMSRSWLKKIFGQPIEASELASLLFSQCVLADEQKVMRKHFDMYKDWAGFQQDTFNRKVFLYLVANIAIALTNASSKDRNMYAVIGDFKKLVSREMNRRWGDNQETVDDSVEKAAANYGNILFTNPEQDRGLSFEWSREWLKEAGIDEFNPATLFEVSHTWKIYHIHLAQFLSKQRVAKG
jgi:hypothetical protein